MNAPVVVKYLHTPSCGTISAFFSSSIFPLHIPPFKEASHVGSAHLLLLGAEHDAPLADSGLLRALCADLIVFHFLLDMLAWRGQQVLGSHDTVDHHLCSLSL